MATNRSILKIGPFFLGVVFLILFRASLALAAPSIRHHELRVELYPEQSRLVGSDTLTIAPNGEATIALDLSSALQVKEVCVEDRPIPFLFHRDRLAFTLPAEYRHREITVTVRYRGKFDQPAPSRPLNTEDPSYGIAATILPQGVFLSGGSGWYPNLPDDRATYRLRVETPKGFRAVTSGRRLAEGMEKGRHYSIWETSYPLPSLALSAGPYEVRQAHLGATPIYTYFYPQSEGLSANYLNAAKKFLNLYQGLLGPYPFKKFAVAENFFPTGYGFPSWALLGKRILPFPFILKISLGHEIAHSWWGNGVWVDYSRGNWSEGLTTYVADYLYRERASAQKGLAYRLKILRHYATLVPPGRGFPLADFSGRTSAASQAIGYGKGAMVFHMARIRVGDRAFWAALRQVVRTKLFQTASWSDFAAALGEQGHCDMRPFFRQWVQRPGAPRLGLADIREEKTDDGWLVRGTLVQKPPFFDIDVPIRLETAGEPVGVTLASHGARTSFTLRASAPPRRLQVDPQITLFRRLSPGEIPPMVNGIRGSNSLIAVATGTLPPKTLAAAEVLLQALGQGNTPIVKEGELRPGALRGHDLLFFGLPRRSGLLGPIPAKLHLEATGFAFEGKSYRLPGDALFVALPNPVDPDRVAAVFLPLSPEAARETVGIIPHYGDESVLVFRRGRTEAKDTWPVTHSPLIHDFAAK